MATATEIQMPTPRPETEPEGRYEVVDGQIQEKPLMGAFEIWIASALFRALVTSPEVQDRGRFVNERLFCLDAEGKLDRRPDLAYVSFERWPRERPIPRVAAWEVVPDLAIEVISPSNKSVDDAAKLEEYFRAGVRGVWVVYPDVAKVYAYESPTTVTILPREGVLEGGDVLPGFRLELAELLEMPESS
ncbi:Uma2 family endonuclease [soil metagenome]